MENSSIYVPMDDTRLARYGENTAREMVVSGHAYPRRIAMQIKNCLNHVSKTQQTLIARSGQRGDIPAAGEWILDNAYIALRAGKEAQQILKKGKRLRRCADGNLLIQHCVKAAVWAVPDLEHRRLAIFLNAFQSVCPLSERELSLFVSLLVWGQLERLASLCELGEKLLESEIYAKQLGEIFSGLRMVEGANWAIFLEEASLVEKFFRQDPTGDYLNMDDTSRTRYRQRLCSLAEKKRIAEGELAFDILTRAQAAEGKKRHIGWYLFKNQDAKKAGQSTGRNYVAAIVGISILCSVMIAASMQSILLLFLCFVPVCDVVKNCADFLIVHVKPPRPVHRLALEDGIPAEGKTVCVITALLTSEEDGAQLAGRMERYRLANRDSGSQLLFGILADLPDGLTPPGQVQQTWLKNARKAVEELNEKYNGGFYLFFRRPVFNQQDERYQGWERKRGALVELTRFLMGETVSMRVMAGDRTQLSGVHYVITLDSDTSLTVGSAREMVGAMLHPLNRAEIDEERNVVVDGYGLLQPRICIELTAANRSFFSRVYGGQGGLDPYGSACSDVYHDLCDEGIYTGKGIFDVKAFHTCLSRRLPDNKILSHDLLEGSYLRCGLLGETELSDEFPHRVSTYFARLHRWVRGDWQLIPWLFEKVPTGHGVYEKNPLSLLSRFKILDNLRRSLSPIFSLLAILLGVCQSEDVFFAAALIAVMAAVSALLLSGAELAARARGSIHVRYHSTIVAGLAGAILQTVIQILFLPYHAFISLTAILAALWRMYISHKNLLAWVTAAQSSGGKGSIGSYYRHQWFAAGIGIVVMGAAELRFGKLVGLIWLLSPLIAWYISRLIQKKDRLSDADRAFLIHQGSLIWNYFQKTLRAEDHYLPPDNWQEQPAVGLARRTSPTNIGMAMLSVFAAVDLEFISKEAGSELLEKMIGTVEQLDKWNGHCYNWYDTSTAEPLLPRYVSAVDSGNFCGCLIALREGLYEWGEAELARRAEALSDAMDFSSLYDKQRKLFYIGYEVEQERLTDGWYDLMASEARQTSFIAIARGDVEPRHWRRLGRMLLGDNDYRGMASWTGTMFEYFMPNLLMCCEENSLIYESLAFCLYAQRRRGMRMKAPWGVSESSFYAFDPAMNYQYKAHGVQSLGLKRNLDREYVVAPYASYLALLLAPKRAIANLRRMRHMGMEGIFGLYEAADFTPERIGDGVLFEPIRSYMSHHMGMSLVAIDNAVRSNVMQARFMRDCSMSAYRQLLQERVPVGAPVMRTTRGEVPEKPQRYDTPALLRSGEGGSRTAPHRHLLSSGGYTVMISDNGSTTSNMGQHALTLNREGRYYAPSGVSAFFAEKENVIGLTLAPLYQKETSHRWEFFGSGAVWTAHKGLFSSRCSVTVPHRENGEVRQYELRWEGEKPLEGELLIYLEPVLCPQRDYDAHPAFSKLFLAAERLPQGVLMTRRSRDNEKYPAFAVCWQGEKTTFSTSREQLLGRGGLRALTRQLGALDGNANGHSEPCLMLRTPVNLKKGQSFSLRVTFACAEDKAAAADAATRLLYGAAKENNHLANLCTKLQLDERQCAQGFALLRALTACEQERQGERPQQSSLWQFGISGDDPIALGRVREENLEQAGLWCRWHQLLTKSGYLFDLALIVDEGGDYRRPIHTSLIDTLKEIGAESAVGARGGIHFVRGDAETAAVSSWAKAALPLQSIFRQDELLPPPPIKQNGVPLAWEFKENTVVIYAGKSLPPLGWSQVLCNKEFGWFTDESGNGILWQGNSREGRLTPWDNDPLIVGGAERLSISVGEDTVSLFAEGDGYPCEVTYGMGFATWHKALKNRLVSTTAFVPLDRPCRIILVALSEGTGAVEYSYEAQRERYSVSSGETLVLVTRRDGDGIATSRLTGEFDHVLSEKELETTKKEWKKTVSALKVNTPDHELDCYLNGWALYQTLACRIYARTSQYQNGGAFGFRDQLQDVCAMLYSAPETAKEQILEACAHQFKEGDVQHWWHPPQGSGVRTMISDDLLWLPYTVARYVKVTGDVSLCCEEVPFLVSAPLGKHEKERYETPESTAERATVYQHCCLAIDCALSRGKGAHGLMRMLGGDWNDGMNRVGIRGQGESVWLSWFAAIVMEDFAVICDQRNEAERAERYRGSAKVLLAAAEMTFEDGWFLRAYYDDGSSLGKKGAHQCEIDSIAQSFSVFAGGGSRDQQERAVSSAVSRLFDRENQVIRLFTPAFDHPAKDPGYIKGYLPGVRENGGQYTHGAVWLAAACLRLDRGDQGYELLSAILPAHHKQQIYKAEPYVLAADVYAAKGYEGRAGWSWYTGAAGWYYRTAIEELLGMQVVNGYLDIKPCLPESWDGFDASWMIGDNATLEIHVKRTGNHLIRLDGQVLKTGVPLSEIKGVQRMDVEF